MAYEIVYTKRFSQKLFKLLDYLRSEWNEPVADKFIIELKNRLRSLSQHPFIATPSLVVKPVRSILITKKTEYFIE
jgi:plasmid stabilization system protein ParE